VPIHKNHQYQFGFDQVKVGVMIGLIEVICREDEHRLDQALKKDFNKEKI